MTFEHIVGDLFAQTDAATAHDGRPVAALGHGVNTHGRWGAGIAPVFGRVFPDAFEPYRAACADRTLTVGGFLPVLTDSGVWVYNLASQDRPGRDARLDAVESSLAAAIAHAETNGVRGFALPRIGAGIGGLDWHGRGGAEGVRGVIERIAGPSHVLVRTVTLPGQAD